MFRGGSDLFCDCWRNEVVVVHLHTKAAASLGHGGERQAVSEHLSQRKQGANDGSDAGGFHALYASAAAVEIAHDRAGGLIRRFNLNVHHRFQQRGLRLFHASTESKPAGHLEGHFIGVNVMIAAVKNDGAKVDDGITSEVASGRGLLHAFLYGRNELAGDFYPQDIIDKLKATSS